jgi:hypothetical protein
VRPLRKLASYRLRLAEKGTARQLLQGVRAMREFVTLMEILDEGRIYEAKRIILLIGSKRFGPPEESTTAALSVIEDLERLEFICDQVLKVKSWHELPVR